MPLIRHIAGVPSATEQRCVRCCEVIVRTPIAGETHESRPPYWPGQVTDAETHLQRVAWQNTFPTVPEDCKPVDLSESQPHVEIHVSGDALIVDHKRIADAVRKAAEEYRSSFGTELL